MIAVIGGLENVNVLICIYRYLEHEYHKARMKIYLNYNKLHKLFNYKM